MSFDNHPPGSTAARDPVAFGVAIDISVTDHTLVITSRGLYVGVTGNVKVDMPGATAITFVGLAAGIIHPIRATKVYKIGTTATSIVSVS